jgi:hypothetical protein
VWHGGTSKQCLRLGARQYRDRCRESATNPTTGNAYPHTYGDSVRAGNANTYTNVDAYSYTNGNAYSERDSDTDTYAYSHANSLAYSYAQGDTKESTNSASSPDTAVRDRES